jgi:hypothetical protein
LIEKDKTVKQDSWLEEERRIAPLFFAACT